jgi:hypothetical protein
MRRPSRRMKSVPASAGIGSFGNVVVVRQTALLRERSASPRSFRLPATDGPRRTWMPVERPRPQPNRSEKGRAAGQRTRPREADSGFASSLDVPLLGADGCRCGRLASGHHRVSSAARLCERVAKPRVIRHRPAGRWPTGSTGWLHGRCERSGTRLMRDIGGSKDAEPVEAARPRR